MLISYFLFWRNLKFQSQLIPRWVILCAFRLNFLLNALPHISQLKDFSPVWITTCSSSLDLNVKCFPQYGQIKTFFCFLFSSEKIQDNEKGSCNNDCYDNKTMSMASHKKCSFYFKRVLINTKSKARLCIFIHFVFQTDCIYIVI